MSTTPARPTETAEIREALTAPPTNPEALREALARHFEPSAFQPAHDDGMRFWASYRASAYDRADALIAGPLAALIALIAQGSAATAQAERTAGELAAAEARIAVLEAELSKRPPRYSPDFPCPKCGVRRGMFPACAQDGCPLLDSNGKPFARAALTKEPPHAAE